MSRECSEALALYFLDSGADDFVRRPCSPLEIVARARALIRRTQLDVSTGHE